MIEKVVQEHGFPYARSGLVFFATEEVNLFTRRKGNERLFVRRFGATYNGCFAAARFGFARDDCSVDPFYAYVEHFFNGSADFKFVRTSVHHERIRIPLVGQVGRFFRNDGLYQNLLSHFR